MIDNISTNDWRKSIVDVLESSTGVMDRKIKYTTLSHVVIGNELFKKTLDRIFLKFLSENEAYLEIFVVYNGYSGAHQVGHKMK